MENQAHLALYRKWRPQTFNEVCGQDHITSVLKYEAENRLFSHAYLFCGSRGTGKTTCAKILAKAVNCENPQGGNPCGVCDACRSIDSGAATDVLEMDAASNNGVENIRDIRDEVAYSPSTMRYRVYIIDEVHMLSVSAFNALLKTLEEPPEHVVFILATTELHKLPATIISRCQRFDFRRVATDEIVARLRHIATAERIAVTDEALHMLARHAQGGMRDAISLLELCAGSRVEITAEIVNSSVGTTGRTAVARTVRAIADADYDKLFDIIADAVISSKDLTVFWQELMSFYRDMLIMKTASNAAKYLDLTDAEAEELGELTARFSRETLLAHSNVLDSTLRSMQSSNAARRTLAEFALIKMSDGRLDTSTDALLQRIAKVEDKLRGISAGEIVASSPVQQPENNLKPVENKEEKPKKEKPAAPQPKPAEESAAEPPVSVEPTPKEPPKPAATEGKRVLKTLRIWSEIVESISREKPNISALLNSSRAYTDPDGKILIRFNNVFAVQTLEFNGGKELIRASLSAELNKPITERDIIYETVAQKGSNAPDETIFDEIDEINNENNKGE